MYSGDSDPKTRREKKGINKQQGKNIYNQKTIRIKMELMENRTRKESNKGKKT